MVQGVIKYITFYRLTATDCFIIVVDILQLKLI